MYVSQPLGDSMLDTIRGWFVSDDVKQIAALTHFIRNSIQTLEAAPIPYEVWSIPAKEEQLKTLANQVAAIKKQFLETMQPYLPASWAPDFLPAPDIWKTYAINVTDAAAVKVVMDGIAAAVVTAGKTLEAITGTAQPNLTIIPTVPKTKGLTDSIMTLLGWGVAVGVVWYGGEWLLESQRRYKNPPRYAR